MPHHTIHIGDSRAMTEVPDQSVHLVVTSPPYWQLKDYGASDQIGFHDSYEIYINNLNLVWQECHRVLHPGCRLCVNIGDQFARTAYYGRYKVVPIRTEIIKFCETVGFDYMGAIIWQKVTTTNTSGGASVMGSYPYPRNGIVKIDYEFILLFKKWGTPPVVSKTVKEASRMTKEEWNRYFTGHWNFAGERQKEHLAMFPEELPHRLIKMFSFVDETVLDPFLGSGTTSLAASKLNRNSIGYEINPDFQPIIEEKLAIAKSSDAVTISKAQPLLDLKKRLKCLPYHFHDPIKFEMKANPRNGQFGSRVSADISAPARQYHRIKQVLSPNLIELDNGEKIVLLGVKINSKSHNAAVEFLSDLTAGQQVFIKHDREEHVETGHLAGYVYLKNMTHVNAHLVKSGLVDVDDSRDYSFRKRFEKYRIEEYG